MVLVVLIWVSKKLNKNRVINSKVITLDTKEQDSLFKDIERRAQNLSLNGKKHPFKWHQKISGLLKPDTVEKSRQALKKLNVDDYVSAVLDPAESATRPSAREALSKLRGKIHNEFELGPLYSLELSLDLSLIHI